LWSKDGVGRYDGDNPRRRLENHPYFTQDGQKGEQYIANMRDGAVAGFKYFDFQKLERVRVTVGGKGEGKMLISTKPDFSAVCGCIPVCIRGEIRDFTADCKIPDGIHALYFRYQGTGTVRFHAFELET
jgi:hypothetical protein